MDGTDRRVAGCRDHIDLGVRKRIGVLADFLVRQSKAGIVGNQVLTDNEAVGLHSLEQCDIGRSAART
jgi:hypothetical protein